MPGFGRVVEGGKRRPAAALGRKRHPQAISAGDALGHFPDTDPSIQFSLDHRAEAVAHALQYARDMGRELADQFVGMYVNHWTLDYGEKGRAAIERFLGQAYERGLLPCRQELEFVTQAEF